jgi:predicted permease
MGTIGQDLRYAFRTLSHAPAFTLVVVLTLALGIGANTAIFTLMDQVLLRALPVHDPGGLVTLSPKGPNMGRMEGPRTFSYPMFRQFREGNEVLEGMLARYGTSLTMLVDNRAERVRGELVTGEYFEVLGLQPAHGRLLGPGDEVTPGGHPVAVLSHAFFSSRFGADPSIVGRQVRLNGHPMTIVGVAPRGFNGIEVGDSPDLFVPVVMKAQMTPTYDGLQSARYIWLNVMGRLKPGIGREQAQAAMLVEFRQLRVQELKEMEATSPRFRKRFVEEAQLLVEPGFKGMSRLREQFSTPMIVLMSMVGLVLLIACANVANLLMARAPARQREIAIRLALGASRGRIVRQLLVESLMLSVLGGAAGVLVAAWTADLLLRALPFERAVATLTSTPDLRVLLFAAGVSLLTGVLFGLVPAWQTARPQLVPALKEESGAVSVGGHVRLRKGLVVAQVALSLLLLVGAGLFARSLWNLRALDPGFRIEQLTTFSVDPALSGYTPERSVHFYGRLRERLAAVPGAASVSLAAVTPLTDAAWLSTVNVQGYRSKEGEDLNPQVNSVGPDYFKTLGIPLVAGRDFSEADGPDAPRVAIVNQKMAEYFWRGQNPIGRRFGFGDEEATIEVIGIARDGKQATLRDEVARIVYTPYMQDPELGAMTVFVRSAAGGITGDTLRQAARAIDASVPVFDLRSMERVADESLFFDRMVAMLSAAFGALATLLAAVGLYGVMSYTVARRRREIGLRMALGAAPRSVVWSVMKEVTLLALVGIVVGVPASVAVSRLVQSQLFGVAPSDPATILAASLTLLAVALLAGYVPAGQATRIDPVRALRAE